MHKLYHIKDCDGTFDQNKAFGRVLSLETKHIFSFDLSKCSDRLPVRLQVDILDLIFGDPSIALS
jgi:hypothetical protein